MINRVLLFLFVFSSALFGSKIADLTPKDVVETLQSITQAHASYKFLSADLIERGLERFLEEIDPAKTYFLSEEIQEWLKPESVQLSQIQSDMEAGNFAYFENFRSILLAAIERRNRLERALQKEALPQEASVKDFKDLDWAQNESDLKRRLALIKALQSQATERLDKSSRQKALQRIEKRRLSREEELSTRDLSAFRKEIYTLILKAFACAFDTHTAYFTPAEAAQFIIQVQQRLFGIGVQLRDDLNGFSVVKIIDGGPAALGTGLKINDRIIAVNGEPVVGLDLIDAVELIRGEEGSSVCLTVLREDNEKHEIDIIRGEVVIQEARIESHMTPFGDGVIAHISLHAFYQDPTHSSAADLYEEIQKISKEHSIKGIILDLRINSGGVLPQAVAVTGLFITKGIVVSIKDNEGNIEHLREIDGRTVYDGPLVVLTSKASASAAEIVAQTLQDYGRAIIVGDDHTFGKGTFQTFTLDTSQNGKINPKGEFKVTRGRYYTVSGKSPQLVGVIPDIIVPGFYSNIDIGEKFGKYPLGNDSIGENFHDDLADIPAAQRDQISWLYRFNLQSKIKNYVRLLPSLKKNSEQRQANDPFFQSFLKDLQNDKVADEKAELYSLEDPQLKEAVNIMKDLILLTS